jgi:hypothetical protein
VRRKKKAARGSKKRSTRSGGSTEVPREIKKLARELNLSTADARDLLNKGNAHRKQDDND